MSKVTILVTQPHYDYTTRYISIWSEKVIKIALEKNDHIVCLKNKKDNKQDFESIVLKIQPDFIMLNGHGNEDTVAGQDNKPIVQVGVNEKILVKKIVYALSCRSAKKLGPASINSGAKCYIGYTDDFIFVIDKEKRSKPLEDNSATLFLEPSNKVAISIIKRKTTGDSYQNSQKAFKKNIYSLLTSESSDANKSALSYLIWDMQHQVCLGDKNAKI